MKNYKQLIKEVVAKKTIIFAFGRFSPPTIGHGLLVDVVKRVADQRSADHVIFASRTQDKKQNPLPVDKKVAYLKKMFPNTHFLAANDNIRTFIEAAKALSKNYSHLVMIAGSDRVPAFTKLLNDYNGKDYKFETIEVISAGERDPDSDTASGMSGTKMREAAKKGDFTSFKKGLPKTLTDTDAKRLMNDVRVGMALDSVKENIEFERNELRENYRAGLIFNIGDCVTDGSNTFEIVDRGTNYITVVNESGDLSKKWLDAVKPIEIQEDVQSGEVPEEITFKGYTTKNLHHSEDAIRAFTTTIDRFNKGQITDPVAILNAIKSTDTYMKINDLHLEQGKAPDKNELKVWIDAHNRARDSLNRIGEFQHHLDYWHTHEHELQDINTNYTQDSPAVEMSESSTKRLTEMKYNPTDRLKIARVIATALGIEDAEKSSNPEMLINNALRKIKSKTMRSEYIDVLTKMLKTADEAGIEYDKKLVPTKATVTEAAKCKVEEEEPKVGDSMHDPETEGVHARKMKIAYKEDMDTAEFTVKKTVGADGKVQTRKVRPHRVTFDSDKSVKESVEEYEDFDEDDLDDMVNSIEDEDDILDAYDDEELALIDDETGEHVDDLHEEVLNEVLSRSERIKAKARFARSSSKRERKIKIALRTRSSSATINNRARRLAIVTMKKRMAKKPLNQLSIGEKERIERAIQGRKALINRLAMKMAPKVRKIESDRLTHKVFTK